ncbi:MAG TPA: HesA/MoeB/ThiF family protein [Anaerolineae bacterium]|nr:HesA/MoeB/ThiF family protein [Anaerolineae bacterium]HQI84600.1 HesA/MoeB/ThiF family protein [Anaerolineae bacterium]
MDDRYIRQIVMPEIGVTGQAKLRESRVLVVGAGGLGSPILLYLAAAGVGVLGIADNDQVALTNLNRQILYTKHDIGRSKALAAVQRVRALNPEVKATPHEVRVLAENGLSLVQEYDLVVEASDNLETKALMNELCVCAGVPLVWGAVARFEGQIGVYLPGHACRSCIFPQLPEPGTYPTPAQLGVLGATAGVIGALEALEAVKILLNLDKPLVDRILLWEGLAGAFDIVTVERNPDCPVCGLKREA